MALATLCCFSSVSDLSTGDGQTAILSPHTKKYKARTKSCGYRPDESADFDNRSPPNFYVLPRKPLAQATPRVTAEASYRRSGTS